jgi:hypothetical protein
MFLKKESQIYTAVGGESSCCLFIVIVLEKMKKKIERKEKVNDKIDHFF